MERLSEKLCEKLVPMIETRLAERFFAAAGRGVLVGSWKNFIRPILIALAFMGLVSLISHPELLKKAMETAHDSGG